MGWGKTNLFAFTDIKSHELVNDSLVGIGVEG
jgi:hypothetical protein